jgi:hypothetical protein
LAILLGEKLKPDWGPGNMTDFDGFICCPHHDKLVGETIATALETAGLRCWIAARDIPLGANFGGAIVEAIDHSHLMMVIISENANQSQQIQREVELASQSRVPILPVRVQDVRPMGALAYLLANKQFFDAISSPLETHLNRLTDVVRAALTRAPYPQNRAGTLNLFPEKTSDPDLDQRNTHSSQADKTAASSGPRYSRTTPEYWLDRVAVDRRLISGDQPMILISFASEDQAWVEDLRAFLDPKIELLRDKHHSPYQLWNFSDAKRGTAPGD